MAYNVLILGASYGSLLATKLLFGGHKITMVCLPNEVEAYNGEGAIVRLPVRGHGQVELNSRKLPGRLPYVCAIFMAAYRSYPAKHSSPPSPFNATVT